LKLFISDDQVLPRISSNVSVFPTEPDADPLSDWLDSLAKIRHEVPDDVTVLPAHNEPFRGLHARLDALAKDHHQTLERLLVSLKEPKRVVDLFSTLFSRPITGDGLLLGLATGETMAHLNYLFKRAEIEVCEISEGAVNYRATAVART
jgi:glyoxylase-like metal-dependent hydrolase (beta-lactamase superfamily II)